MSLFDTGVRPAIDAYLAKKAAETRDYGSYWSASSAGYCQRLVIMRRLGVPKVPELQEDWARTTRVFEAGHVFHEWIQRITKDAGLSIASEVELQDEDLMIRGHFDDLILMTEPLADEIKAELSGPLQGAMYVPKQHLILYDYKTANSKSFDYKKDQIGYYHKMQLGTYMYMLRSKTFKWTGRTNYTLEPNALSEARILTIEKDTLRMKEHDLHWSTELEKQVTDYWTSLNATWKSRKLPPCTCLDHDGGFLGKRTKKGKVYNDFFYNDEPCSLEWYKLWKEKKQ